LIYSITIATVALISFTDAYRPGDKALLIILFIQRTRVCHADRTDNWKHDNEEKQETQLSLGRADRRRMSEGQQMLFVSCERAYATFY